MRWLLALSVLLIASGVLLLKYASRWPVYTDATAPDRIATELLPPRDATLNNGDMDARFAQWFSRLHAYETPYKRLTDLGHGLTGAGLGCLLATGLWWGYHRFTRLRSLRWLLGFWVSLWLLRIPFSFGSIPCDWSVMNTLTGETRF